MGEVPAMIGQYFLSVAPLIGMVAFRMAAMPIRLCDDTWPPGIAAARIGVGAALIPVGIRLTAGTWRVAGEAAPT